MPDPKREVIRLLLVLIPAVVITRFVMLAVTVIVTRADDAADNKAHINRHRRGLLDLPAHLGVILTASLIVSAVLFLVIAGLYWYRRVARIREDLRDVLTGQEHRTLRRPVTGPIGAALAVTRTLRDMLERSEEQVAHHQSVANAATRKLAAAAGASVDAEERLRANLVADLHDTVAQQLYIASYLADAIDADLAATVYDPTLSDAQFRNRIRAVLASGDLPSLSGHVRTADRQLRAVLHEARPVGLENGDLAGAVNHLAETFTDRSGLPVAVEWPDQEIGMSLTWAAAMFRFCQEALHNVVKHAHASAATIRFSATDSDVVVTVEDNGRGFDCKAQRAYLEGHFGLGLLTRRAEALSGSLTVNSHPGAGTRVTLRLPRQQQPRRCRTPEMIPEIARTEAVANLAAGGVI